MQRIGKVRMWLAVSVTSFLVAVGYELKLQGFQVGGIPSVAVALFTIVIGGQLVQICVDALLNKQSIRMRIFGADHVEGYWYLQTDKTGDSPLSKDGILYISHLPSIGETKVITTRIDEEGKEFPTESEVAYFRAEAARKYYMNHFRLTYPGPETKFGVSFGRFINPDDVEAFPTRFEATITLEGESVVRRQHANKIDERIVKKFKQQYGAHWKTEFLRINGDESQL